VSGGRKGEGSATCGELHPGEGTAKEDTRVAALGVLGLLPSGWILIRDGINGWTE